jgi:hypothetical protein
LRAAANHERERRRRVDEARWEEAREQLYRELDEMAARLLAVRGEPSEEERKRSFRELDAWFAERAKRG